MNRKKELFWILGTLLAVVVLNILFFGFEVLQLNGAVELNVHDTYFIISNTHLFIWVTAWVLFAVYLIRMLRSGYRNFTANLIFIGCGIFCVLILSYGIKPLNQYALSTEAGAHNLPINQDILSGVSLALTIIRICIIGLIFYAIYKTKKNYIKNI